MQHSDDVVVDFEPARRVARDATVLLDELISNEVVDP
jgi:hypothetical protein